MLSFIISRPSTCIILMGLSPSTDTRIPISATALNVSMLPFLLRALVELLGRAAVACKRISIIIWLVNNVLDIHQSQGYSAVSRQYDWPL